MVKLNNRIYAIASILTIIVVVTMTVVGVEYFGTYKPKANYVQSYDPSDVDYKLHLRINARRSTQSLSLLAYDTILSAYGNQLLQSSDNADRQDMFKYYGIIPGTKVEFQLTGSPDTMLREILSESNAQHFMSERYNSVGISSKGVENTIIVLWTEKSSKQYKYPTYIEEAIRNATTS